ncbi:hypothetical protein [Nonomuraea fuscirosea]|uniref:hypothetical protein n=1 Tax=Nonomuraea fuscirosea TaxID=1291556 RepID=UPI0034265929
MRAIVLRFQAGGDSSSLDLPLLVFLHLAAVQTDERERIYQGTTDVASIRIWLRDPIH